MGSCYVCVSCESGLFVLIAVPVYTNNDNNNVYLKSNIQCT